MQRCSYRFFDMKYIFIMTFMLCALMMKAQKVEISVSGNWAEIPVQQTQSELKPGWKIVDYQMKSRLTRYLSGGHASQLAEGNRPVFRITPGENEVLASYAIIENNYKRLDLNLFDIKADGDSFVCQPLQPLQAGEYILVNLQGKTIGELGDLLVYPFCIAKE